MHIEATATPSTSSTRVFSKIENRPLAEPTLTPEQIAKRAALPVEEKIRRQENANIDAMMRIHKKIDELVDDPETADALKPWYMLMCKRPCFDNDYLPTYNRPNVHLVDTRGLGITQITEVGPVFEERSYPLDLLIYATGFEVQQTGIYNQIRGKNGLDLDDKYRDGIRTVLGIHSANRRSAATDHPPRCRSHRGWDTPPGRPVHVQGRCPPALRFR